MKGRSSQGRLLQGEWKGGTELRRARAKAQKWQRHGIGGNGKEINPDTGKGSIMLPPTEANGKKG